MFAINGNFRHYHVSFRYPPWLEHWLQSPGMHHVHHSYLPHHRDKNLGLVTSVWDRLVGTLYIGSPYEEPPWGLGPDEQAHYSTFMRNVFGPFRDVYRLTGPRRMFPLVSQAIARIIPLKRLRWITFGHVESDECGAMNEF